MKKKIDYFYSREKEDENRIMMPNEMGKPQYNDERPKSNPISGAPKSLEEVLHKNAISNSPYGVKNNSPATDNPMTYQSPYSAQIDNILNNILNRQPFSYNMSNDPLYKQYSDQYMRQGNLSMRDTMGNTAALTGGYGSSYGAIAGSQAYDSYLQQLNDRVPELYQLAFEKYQSELNNDYNELSALQSLEQNAYNRYQTDRSFDYGVSQDQLSQQNYLDEIAYRKSQDELAHQNYMSEIDYMKSQDALQQQNYMDETQYNRGVDERNYDYMVGQDEQAQRNYENEFSYQKSQDAQDQTNWQTEYEYMKAQDELDRQAAEEAYLNELAVSQTQEATKASQEKITKFSKNVAGMLEATSEDEFGNKASKYTVDEVWDYLNGSGLSDEEIAIIVNDNYQLRKYVEGILGNTEVAPSGHGRSKNAYQQRM